MIYLVIQGACGNQFFQYAFARAMQEKTGEKLVIDFKCVRDNPDLWAHSDEVMTYFNTKYEEGNADNLIQSKIIDFLQYIECKFKLEYFTKKRYWFLKCCSKLLNPLGVYYFDAAYYRFPIAKTKNKVIRGFFESPKYFAEIDDLICEELEPKYPLLQKNQELYDKIMKSESVCVTIKRQDIENAEIKDVYDYSVTYFYNAIEYLKKLKPQIKLFVFSDDIEWCKNNLNFKEETFFESGTDPIWEKVRLMSSCKNFIIHNSTFSWWVQHLSRNKNKVVIAPPKWMQRDDQPIDIYEETWIYLDDFGKKIENHY